MILVLRNIQIFLSLVLALLSGNCASKLKPGQYNALKSLYSSTGGESWNWARNSGRKWNFSDSSDPCESQWEGLVCFQGSQVSIGIDNTLSSIALSGYNLNGTLPDEMFSNLSSIHMFNLSRNSLRGTLPVSMRSLSNLTVLDLSKQAEVDSTLLQNVLGTQALITIYEYIAIANNSAFNSSLPSIDGIRGEVPDEIFSGMSFLQVLSLNVNRFIGSLPKSLCNCCPYLQVITLGSNYFSGSIPECYGNISSLLTLEISANNLTSSIPESLGNLSELQHLVLGVNSMSGTIPTSFSTAFPNLDVLILRNNYFYGDISVIGSFKNLSILDISSNKFVGRIPESMENLLNLQHIWLFNNSFTGSIPVFFGNFSIAQSLVLATNSFNGSIPVALCNLTSLQYLDLSTNRLTGPIPDIFSKLNNLLSLNLGDNSMMGPLPESLYNLYNIQQIQMNTNRFTGTLSESISKLSSLRVFALRSNRFCGEIPKSIGSLQKLNILILGNNYFEGSLPTSLYSLPDLTQLILSRNSFGGQISWGLGNLSKLQNLQLQVNNFEGSLPRSLCYLNSMVVLNLFSNNFRSRFPDCIYNLTKLEGFQIQLNYFTGSLPNILSNMSRLLTLDMSNNKFSGEIPSYLFSLKSLKDLFLDINELSGPLPEISGANVLMKLDVSSNFLTGIIPSTLFQSPLMTVFAASNNCFDLNSVDNICEIKSIKQLYFIGVGRNTRCPRVKHPSLFAFYELPSCLWSNISSLEKIYLAGNAYYGSLESFQIPNVRELNLDSNNFYKTLPGHVLNGKHFEVFDISNNRFEGYLNFALHPYSKSSVLYADVNRLSGKIDFSAENFSSVSTLTGNIISCETLPKNDKNIDHYVCETRDVEYAIYAWSIAAFLCMCGHGYFFTKHRMTFQMFLINIKRFFYSSEIFVSKYSSKYPISINFLLTTRNLLRFSVGFVFTMIITTLLIYGLITVDKSNSTHFERYFYSVSGLFVKGSSTAILVFFVYLSFSVVFLLKVFNLFLTKWYDRIPYENIIFRNTQTTRFVFSAFPLFRKDRMLIWRLVKGLSFICFISFPPIINAIYVYYARYLQYSALASLQFTIFVVNTLYTELVLPRFIIFFFGKYEFFSVNAVYIAVVLEIYVEFVTPLLATLFVDPLCFNSSLFPPDPISVSYSYEICEFYNTFAFNFGECLSKSEELKTVSFNPPFIYSYQCRNAVLRNYIPIIIYSCAYSTFVRPGVYWISIHNVIETSQITSFYGFISSKRKLLVPNIPRYLTLLFRSFVSLLTYGIIVPYCAFAIGCEIIVSTILLIYHIELYCKNDRTEHGVEIENMCENGIRLVHVYLWPGLTIGAIFIALYIFDTDIDNNRQNLVSSFALVSLTLSFVFIARIVYFSLRKRFLASLPTSQVDESDRQPIASSFSGADMNTSKYEDEDVINPISRMSLAQSKRIAEQSKSGGGKGSHEKSSEVEVEIKDVKDVMYLS